MKDIKDAPRDGTEVIVMHYKDYEDGDYLMIDGPYTAAFINGEWVSSWGGQRVISYMDWGVTEYKPIMTPTHWVELPQPPKETCNER